MKTSVMETSIDIEHLSREEKLRLMHRIWENLVKGEQQIESPEWHKNALSETEKRVQSGEEAILDWADAKEELKKRFE